MTPFYGRLPDVAGFGVESRVDLIGAALKVIARHERLRHLDELIGVEIEVREDRVEALRPLVLVVVLQEWIRRSGNAGDIPRVHEALSTKRLRVSDEQRHRLLSGLPFSAVEHLFFVAGEFHFRGILRPKWRKR